MLTLLASKCMKNFQNFVYSATSGNCSCSGSTVSQTEREAYKP